ncbi:MAG: hypothetical protein H6765_01850 [Candidatus Peribacteria bacterium]|nr:MAG: hypothetical protein H6765_01850 [Candidatus Peribacteria bacterium]
MPQAVLQQLLNVRLGRNYTLTPDIVITPYIAPESDEKTYLPAYQVHTDREVIFYNIDNGEELFREPLFRNNQFQANVYYNNKSNQEMRSLPEIKYNSNLHADVDGNANLNGSTVTVRSESTIGADPAYIKKFGSIKSQSYPVANIVDTTSMGTDVMTSFWHLKHIRQQSRVLFP